MRFEDDGFVEEGVCIWASSVGSTQAADRRLAFGGAEGFSLAIGGRAVGSSVVSYIMGMGSLSKVRQRRCEPGSAGEGMPD